MSQQKDKEDSRAKHDQSGSPFIEYRGADENPIGSADGSDDDDGAVEVTFDSGNPYRRKASLVSSDWNAASRQKITSGRRSECVVHQFLEQQRRKGRSSFSPVRESETQSQGHTTSADAAGHEGTKTDAARLDRQDSGVSPRGQQQQSRCKVEVDNSDSCNGGQPDQKAWAKEMAMNPSEWDQPQPGQQDAIHSRMLTKRQLSDMAWGVRELSRRLSSMRLKFRARSIFILTKVHDTDLIRKTRDVTYWLLDKARQDRYVVYVEKKLKTSRKFDAPQLVGDLARLYAGGDKDNDNSGMTEDEAREDIERRLRYWEEDMCRTKPHNFDLVVTLGGDGTVLFASWLFQRIVPPVISFSLGSLGFLTKFDFAEYKPILSSALNKGVTVSLRLRFECTVMRSVRKKHGANSERGGSGEDEEELHRQRDLVEEVIGEESDDERTHQPDGTYEILNEVVVDRGPNPTMSYTEVFGDDEHFTSVLADGICVSTPTGSTAYNLAAGGSLCHPENPVMLLTSICAHTLSFRPIILPDTIVLRVGVPYDARTESWASFDGRERVELHPGDYVTISASRYPFASVLGEGRRSEDWVDSISGKLGWNKRQKQKVFKDEEETH